MKIGIIFPVYNETKRLERGITLTEKFIKASMNSECRIYIVDNASTDSTGSLARELESKYPNIEYHRIEIKGVGAAFREGVRVSRDDDVIGYMDVDLSTDIEHLKEVERIFADGEADVVNGSRFNRKSRTSGRKWYRNITSYGLIFLLKLFLQMRASDAICGFKFFKREVVSELVKESSSENGWFYMIELLLRAERKGTRIYELPVRWADDTEHSKVEFVKVIRSYIAGIVKLRKEFRK